jgi:oligopeptide transport system ATP-binding protein
MKKINIEKIKNSKGLLSEKDLIEKGITNTNFLLKIKNLKINFPIYGGIFRHKIAELKAVDDISFYIEKGKTLGLVGESGCGKTTIGRSIIRIYDITYGDIIYKLTDNNKEYYINLSELNKSEMRNLRSKIQMIFQDPYSSLNPRFTVGDIIEEPIKLHSYLSESEIKNKAYELLSQVGLSAEHYYRYPHEFSGGQRQRIGIARALSTNPSLIIADEPVSALDVSVQAQVINLMQDLQDEYELSYIFIAHDLSVVKHIAHQIAVMYLGKIVEIGEADEIYNNPQHPYTICLLNSIPKVSSLKTKTEKIKLIGDVPSPVNKPFGCSFNTRCPEAKEICFKEEPKLNKVNNLSSVACHFIK